LDMREPAPFDAGEQQSALLTTTIATTTTRRAPGRLRTARTPFSSHGPQSVANDGSPAILSEARPGWASSLFDHMDSVSFGLRHGASSLETKLDAHRQVKSAQIGLVADMMLSADVMEAGLRRREGAASRGYVHEADEEHLAEAELESDLVKRQKLRDVTSSLGFRPYEHNALHSGNPGATTQLPFEGDSTFLLDFLAAHGYLNSPRKDVEAQRPVQAVPGVSSACDLWCQPMDRIIHMQAFEYLFGIIIFCNAITMGMEADNAFSEDTLVVMEHLFTTLFSVELICKICGLRFRFHTDPWNIFDAVCVGSSILDAWFMPLFAGGGDSADVSVARLFRVFRLFKASRILRILRVFKELRILVQGMVSSTRSLVWILLLVVLITYVCGVFLTNFLSDHFDKVLYGEGDGEDEVVLVKDLFGTVSLSMFSLMQLMTLDRWTRTVARPMLHVSSMVFVVFIIYLVFATFALLNIVTGVFVSATVTASRRDEDQVLHSAMSNEGSVMDDLHSFFDVADSDQSGTITLEEFQELLRTQRGAPDFLQKMNVTEDEATGLFKLLDINDSGTVSVAEFIFGCLRIHVGLVFRLRCCTNTGTGFSQEHGFRDNPL